MGIILETITELFKQDKELNILFTTVEAVSNTVNRNQLAVVREFNSLKDEQEG
jgi:hypothetical protein